MLKTHEEFVLAKKSAINQIFVAALILEWLEKPTDDPHRDLTMAAHSLVNLDHAQDLRRLLKVEESELDNDPGDCNDYGKERSGN